MPDRPQLRHSCFAIIMSWLDCGNVILRPCSDVAADGLAEGYDLEAMDGSCLDLAITESESVAGYYLYEVYNSSSDCFADH